MTTCERFDAWLDAGMPAADDAALRAHASGCARCAGALDAAAALEVLLAAPPAPAPPAFTDAVMHAIAHERAERIAAAGAPRELLPVWVRTAAEPRVAAAVVIAALVVWQGPRMWTWASSLGLAVARDASTWTTALAPPDDRWLYGFYLWLGAGMTWAALAFVRRAGAFRLR